MNRDQKEATRIVAGITEVTKTLGLVTFGLGRSVTMMMFDPKQAAALLVKASQQLELISEQVLGSAEEIVKWDQKRIITRVDKGLVDAHSNPVKA